jgi:phospholipid/cholesterol/gamma-HCH transport system substrate-binding protein
MKFSKEYKIGLSVLAALLILIFGINFLKGKSMFVKDTEYVVYYTNIDGLKEGSYVLTRGFKVGVVKDIQFDGSMAERMKVTFLINEKINFPKDSKVRIFSMDLMGTRGLDIIAGQSLMIKNDGDEFIGEIEGSFKDEIGRHITPLKNKTERLLSSIDSILVSVHAIVNDDTKEKIKMSLNSVRKTFANLESTSRTIDKVISRDANSISNLISNTESISDNLRKNNEKITSILSNVSSITDSLNVQGLGKGLRDLIATIDRLNKISAKLTTDDSSAGAMINDRELYNNLNEIVSNLNRVVLDFEKNPRKYIKLSIIGFGGASKLKTKYIIVAFDSSVRLVNANDNKGLKELFYKGRYLYFSKKYDKREKADKAVSKLINEYPKAFVQEIKE